MRVSYDHSMDLPTGNSDEKNKAIVYGSLMTAAMAAAAFAAVLALVGLKRTDYVAQCAMTAFCIATPLLIAHRLVTVDTGRSYKVSCLHRMTTLLGVIAFIIGVAFMVSMVSLAAAVVLVLLSLAMTWIVEGAEHRAFKHQGKQNKPEGASDTQVKSDL